MQQGSGLAIRGDTLAVRGILLDLEGVVYVRDTLLPGSRDAISRIQAAGIPLKFITNTTRRRRRRIALAGMGLRAALDDIYTPAAIARDFLADRNLTPFLVVHPDLREDFSGLRTGAEEAVVIGDAGEFFTYDLNCAGEGSGLLVGTAKLNGAVAEVVGI
jgi:ribonucleotide monophosphatase NagD (HAD superfamily)